MHFVINPLQHKRTPRNLSHNQIKIIWTQFFIQIVETIKRDENHQRPLKYVEIHFTPINCQAKPAEQIQKSASNFCTINDYECYGQLNVQRIKSIQLAFTNPWTSPRSVNSAAIHPRYWVYAEFFLIKCIFLPVFWLLVFFSVATVLQARFCFEGEMAGRWWQIKLKSFNWLNVDFLKGPLLLSF